MTKPDYLATSSSRRHQPPPSKVARGIAAAMFDHALLRTLDYDKAAAQFG